jgi:hypothetical protein
LPGLNLDIGTHDTQAPRQPPVEMEQGMTGDETGPRIQLSTDEDWKNRVKAEDAAIDQQFRQKDEPASPQKATVEAGAASEAGPASEAPQNFPEANFDALVAMLTAQAMVALGAVPNPGAKKAEIQLPMAKYLIDLLGVLEQRTAGNLSEDEAESLNETLHSLRMMYVQRSKMTT